MIKKLNPFTKSLFMLSTAFSLSGHGQPLSEVPHERTIPWKTESAFAQSVYQSFASKKLVDEKISERGNTPRILLAKLLLKQDVDKVNAVILKMKVRGVSGSHWALNPKGDYDFTIAPLTTLLYLFGDKPDLLYPKTTNYLLTVLLSESGKKFRRSTPRTLGLVTETENHVLMTEGSRYLKNRWIMLHGDTSPFYDNVKNGMEARLLTYLERMKTQGLYEFNSIPYIGYTLMALLNLEGFASEKVRTEARNVLDYMNWTYALGSYKLRAYPPMRRRYEKAAIQELSIGYQTVFMKSWLSYAPVEPFNVDISHAEVHALVGSCMPYRPADKVVELQFNKGNGYFVKLGHGKRSCPEIYTAGKHYLLSAGGANQGKSSIVVARPTTLFLNDTADQLAQTFHLTGSGADFMTWNNTGVYKNFACASGPVVVPTNARPVAQSKNWTAYAASEDVVVAVRSVDGLGLMAVFEDQTADAVLQNLEKANPDASLLKTGFQFPNGQKIAYDVAAPKNKWVVQSIDGVAANRDFDIWPLINEQ